ncbi:DNA polymerase III subunit gamma/tau [Serpentinicella alkaliphila]|uniref:DNA-directed DNA polymerase n=1 Tax=Serpentinicella alkaliphila TaxID=1734049 RepID=A0A4R2TIX9_9FIRM|nr:DNA polymerase III subunit gamma/tau [Serpentinicella alkaliphila]QUH25163.1 DNA polymerase III subunit gamma/tau [Serpentinicella alkaliphila]TCQ02252.1 DNA polymerase-3 subunit gamma/tau [Serpentinicella alkaliphila]
MGYKALYRKWRPKVFEDVIGQEHIVKTLKNQILTQNIAHAYLFSGTRGTGKTSTAKIFARAVNCLNQLDANPCNECEVCKDILNESIMDVIEIDAASNNGVDNIREIRENVKYPPSKGKYKVYIIDEVHMLSTGAFNALLKTLEEPPAHVIFILATTEIQKLPATILSRCQKFDFKPVKTKDMIELLNKICNSMDITSEEEALRLIALHAEGALRDALSLLEQCISFGQHTLNYEEVLDVIGAVNHNVLINLTSELINKRTSEALYSLDKMVLEGKDIHQLIKDLIQHCRSLLLAKLEVKIDEMIPLSLETIQLIIDQSKTVEENWVIAAIHSLSDIESKMKYASNPRILFEIGLVSLCNRQFENSQEGLLERIQHLESQISKGIVNDVIVNERTYESLNEIKYEIKKEDKNETKNEKNEEVKYINRDISTDNKKLQERIEAEWPAIIDVIRKEKKATASSLALLKEGMLAVLSNNLLEISLSKDMAMFKEKLDKDKVKNYISGVVERHIGQPMKIVFGIQGEKREEKQDDEELVIKKLKSIVPESIFEIIE